jgi:hypothetical protein
MDNLFIIIIFFVISLVIFSIISSKNREFSATKFISLLYIITASICVGIGGFLGNKYLLDISYSMVFYLLIGWMLIMGISHVLLLIKLLSWPSEKHFWIGFFFTFIIALIGGIFLLIVFQISKYSIFTGINLITLLVFVMPYIFYGTFIKYTNIPVKVLRKWYYPFEQHVEEPHDRELESPLVVGFEFKKRANDENMASFRAKAPKEMTFGKLFYYFINDYNDRNPEEKIEFLNENNRPVSWIFYIKPNWFGRIRYIDPEETNSFNFIKENDVIVCKRVIEK